MAKKKDRATIKSYQQDLAITSLMTKLLQLKTDMEERDIVNKRRKRYLDKEKVSVLNNYIFPSMANLTFFFKCMATYPELREIFEEDIKDLLGVRRENPQPNNYGFIIFNLLHSILLVTEGVYDQKRRHNKDFRLRLNQLLQEIVWGKVHVSLTDVFKNASAQRVVSDDFNRVWAWTRMLAESIDQSAEDKVPPRRTIRFRTHQLREHDEPI